MVLLVLAGIWAAVLIPPAVRARAEGRPGDSIHNFKRQLTVLRRTGPHRGSVNGGGRVAGGDHWYRSSSASLTPVHGPLRSARTAPIAAHRGPVRQVRAASAATAARSRTIRRRRDILTALLVAVVATLVLGVLLGGIMLVAHVVADILLIAYVALLVHQRNVAAEREMKVRFLPQPHRLDPALLRAEPALLRRSAN